MGGEDKPRKTAKAMDTPAGEVKASDRTSHLYILHSGSENLYIWGSAISMITFALSVVSDAREA